MVLYLPKGTKKDPFPQIKTVGSGRLQPFIENDMVREAFVETVRSAGSLALVTKEPTLKEEMPLLDESFVDASMAWKRGKLSELVKMYMRKTKNMSAGYWGKEDFKPEFWPTKVEFRPPSTNRAVNSKVLCKEEMDIVLKSYLHWRGETSFFQQLPVDTKKENKAGTTTVEEKKLTMETKNDATQNEDTVSSIRDEMMLPVDTKKENKAGTTTVEEKKLTMETKNDATQNEDTVSSIRDEMTLPVDTKKENKAGTTTVEEKKLTMETKNDATQNEDTVSSIRDEMTKKHPDYKNVSRLLANANWETFVDACKILHPFILRPTRENYENDSIASDSRFDEYVPAGYKAGKSLEQGDCLFSSMSMLLTGLNDSIHEYLRIGAAVYGQIHLQHFFEKVIEDGIDNMGAAQMFLNSVCTDVTISKLPKNTTDFREIILFALQEEVQITAKPACYSGPLQVMFLSGFIDMPIQQISSQNLPGYDDIVFPCICSNTEQTYYDMLTILWLSFGGSPSGHVVPLFKLKADDSRKEVKYVDFLDNRTLPAKNNCSAQLYGWCLDITDGFMIQCERCKSWVHPHCFGIPTAFYKRKSSLPFYCCWDDSCTYYEFPEISRIGTTKYNINVGLQDLISLRPGNWLTDVPISILCRHLSSPDKCKFVFLEERKSAIKTNTAVFCSVVSRNHWWSVLYLEGTILVLDSLKRAVDEAALNKIYRLLGIQKEDIDVSVVDVPQQDNVFDCGAYTAAFMLATYQFFGSQLMPAQCHVKDIVSVFTSLAVNATETRRDMKELLLTQLQPESRKSNRRCHADLIVDKQKDLKEKIESQSEEGLKSTIIEGKGRGVLTTQPFTKGEFLVEYIGDLLSGKEAGKREKKYRRQSGVGCFMLYFSFKSLTYCIDATEESCRLGRLINHSKASSNCHMKIVEIKSKPHIVFVASRDLTPGEELLYDYGDYRKSAIESHPWLKS